MKPKRNLDKLNDHELLILLCQDIRWIRLWLYGLTALVIALLIRG